MTHRFLVETPQGTLVRTARKDIKPNDAIVFDGPDAFASTDALKRLLVKEIEAAGGIESWRRKGAPSQE